MGCNTYSTLQVVLKSKRESYRLLSYPDVNIFKKGALSYCRSLSNLFASDDLPLAGLFSV